MRLTDNKEGIIDNKVFVNILREEINIWDSNWDIGYEQDIWLSSRISPNNLIHAIYNEINR